MTAITANDEIILSQRRMVRVTNAVRLPFQLAVLRRDAVHRRSGLAAQVEMATACRRPAVTVDVICRRGPDHLAGCRLDGDSGAGTLAPGVAARAKHDP